MHYKNGRPAREGDLVIGPNPTFSNQERPAIAGVIFDLAPGAETCNATLARLTPGGTTAAYPMTVTLGEFYHIDDAFRALDAIGKANDPARIEENACKLYTRYCDAVGGEAYNGDPLPTWELMCEDPAKQLQVSAWRAIAYANLQEMAGGVAAE